MSDSDLADFDRYAGDDATSSETAESSDRSGSAGADTGSETDEAEFSRHDVETASPSAGIGTVPVSCGLKIAEEGEDTSLRATITDGNREGIRLGKYLLVPYPDGETLFTRITELEYVQEFHSDDTSVIHSRRQLARTHEDFEEADYKFMATLEPLSVLYEEGGELKRRMTDRVPKPGATVSEATDKTDIKTGLKIPEAGVFLGHLSVGGQKIRTGASPPTIDYRLKDEYTDGDPLVFRHTLVAGGTGSGKTHGSKNVLRQYLADDRSYRMDDGRDVSPAVVMFDPQDEYAQMHDDNEDLDREFARRLEREAVAHGGHDDTVAFVPTVGSDGYGGSNHRAEQVRFTIPFSMADDNPWLVAGGGLNDNQYPALLALLDRFFGQHPEGTYREFVQFLDDPALKEELDESGRVHEATFDAVKRRVRAVPGQIFDQDAKPITQQIKQFVRPGGLTVVPTYHLSSTRAKEVVVLAVASLLIDNKLSSDPDSRFERIKETPMVLGMDEAHNFLTDADNVQARKVIAKFTEAAKQGRKERLGLFLITQDPQDIADAVFKQINSTIVLNLGDEEAIKSVNIPSNLERKVPYMEKGQMVVYSPDNSEPVELIGLSKCVTRHGD
jgi:DNA helicase HerA-like ATPase